ncbi:MAG: TatD family hydrolase [Nanoarchaeota archaeon]|nr:TatD family hydrolase [Nanoarchaeota archaeon]
MIDSHCHLEQEIYKNDLDEIIQKCKTNGLRAVITSCTHPKDFKKTMDIINKYRGFVFATAGIHPLYIKEISEKEIKEYMELLRNNKDKLVGIGECGLDFHYIEEPEQRERQKQLFIKMIALARELNKPLVIHARDALEETLKILNEENAANVMLHMWGGHNLMDQVNTLGYHVSMNSIIMKSKTYGKVIKKIPIDKLMLETDSPWIAIKKVDDGYEIDNKGKNDPTTIKLIAEKIAKIKNVEFEKVWKTCSDNAVMFFNLNS